MDFPIAVIRMGNIYIGITICWYKWQDYIFAFFAVLGNKNIHSYFPPCFLLETFSNNFEKPNYLTNIFEATWTYLITIRYFRKCFINFNKEVLEVNLNSHQIKGTHSVSIIFLIAKKRANNISSWSNQCFFPFKLFWNDFYILLISFLGPNIHICVYSYLILVKNGAGWYKQK